MAELVNFFVIGVQKGGTTALAWYLQQHSAIQMSHVKEVHHFDNEQLNWSAPNHEGLHVQFDWNVRGVLRGEATPIYIYWPWSLSRLKRYNPSAKLIVALRHPSFRAFSHWRMEKMRNAESLSFDEAISDLGRHRVKQSPSGVHRVYSYVERSLYSEQIDRLLELFPRQQVHFFRADSLWSDPCLTLAGIESFLEVEIVLGSCAEQKYIVPINSIEVGDLPSGQRPVLDCLFLEDIRETARLTKLDLTDWLSPGYREPMQQLSK